MVVFDTSVLLLVLAPSTNPPLDPSTNVPLQKANERIEYLIDTLSKDRKTIIIPTPVLSEVMVYAGTAGPRWLQYFNNTAVFRIASFDQKAAIEAALSIKDSLDRTRGIPPPSAVRQPCSHKRSSDGRHRSTPRSSENRLRTLYAQ